MNPLLSIQLAAAQYLPFGDDNVPLPYVAATLDGIDESLHQHYTELPDDQGFELNTTVPPKVATLATQLRKQNANLAKANKLAKSFEGIDPEEAKSQQDTIGNLEAELEAMRKDSGGNVDDIVNARVKTATDAINAKLTAAQRMSEDRGTLVTNLTGKLNKIEASHTAMAAIESVGQLRKGASRDVLNRFAEDYHRDDEGNLVPNPSSPGAINDEGILVGSEEEWAKLLLQRDEHLFMPGGGGGSAGNTRPGHSKPGVRRIKRAARKTIEDIKALSNGTATYAD